jgi:hypothetical protein
MIPMTAVVSGTPYYVLLEGNRRVGPHVVKSHWGIECSSIYGFSDKKPYETFQSNSQLPLTPYPLVKMYLRNEANTSGEGLKLVVLDAPGPDEQCLLAATHQAVLEAQEEQATHVTAAYRLIFDPQIHAYTVEAATA